ncbi:class I SAM-dependent methyltransferase [Catenovulum sp. SM1970]|uniref:class I SAM-dependent methyltransferase n=1 Tax=Marinifaba aquimaris TaxID=2741323 RepID=UPI001573AD61|nr:class I SAM-dependent methyltransferase [Marinifaba aquimaris]NTS78700.1 class I SAM-dependent methyltransferase [Marinifaba aquimaris]
MSVEFYNNNSTSFYESTKDVDMSTLYDEFLPAIKTNGSILDAGCGSGRDSLNFKNLGYQVSAFDASEALVKLATDLLNQTVELATFDSFKTNKTFDGIWACASLLHVAKNELPATFKKLTELLNNRGVFYCSFKYGKQTIEREERVFTNLNEMLLENSIANTGLHINKTWVTADQRPGRENEKWLNAILVKG